MGKIRLRIVKLYGVLALLMVVNAQLKALPGFTPKALSILASGQNPVKAD
jgi:hypothetical protein